MMKGWIGRHKDNDDDGHGGVRGDLQTSPDIREDRRRQGETGGDRRAHSLSITPDSDVWSSSGINTRPPLNSSQSPGVRAQ